MSVERSRSTGIFRRHGSFDLEAAMAAAQDAASRALSDAGMPNPQVVVNVSWVEGGREFVAGGAVPGGISRFIAESLRATADEIDGADPSGETGTVN